MNVAHNQPMATIKSPNIARKAKAEDAQNRRMRAAVDALPLANPGVNSFGETSAQEARRLAGIQRALLKPQHGGARPGAGRPAIEPGQETVTITVRVTAAQREKFHAIGGSDRFRAWLDRVKK